jgi:superfamily I DNA/RNA helicase
MDGPDSEQKYQAALLDRQKYLDAILNSSARKKIVVAGPGTGKTFLFKKILEGKANSLTLTFVNSLVEDLSLELCDLSQVRTLHSFARGLVRGAAVFPKLSKVIRENANILLEADIDFEKIFFERDDKNDRIPFYSSRLGYYGHYGYTDIIFAAVKILEKNPDRIPIYEQVLVDEFQDFNRLEVSLIDLLSDKSPILLVGDDDQALYDFKKASPEHIRNRHGDQHPDFASFTLPYCSRCTRVIVDAINDILLEATKKRFLSGRVEKQYIYFDQREKDKDCYRYPKLSYFQKFSRQIPWLIENQIAEIAMDQKTRFSVLIICPTKTQCRTIAAALKRKGLRNVAFVDKESDDEPSIKDGLKLLLSDVDSNLGWRIALKEIMPTQKFEALLAKTGQMEPPNLIELVDTAEKKEIKNRLKALRNIKNDQDVSDESCDELFKSIDINARDLAKEVSLR